MLAASASDPGTTSWLVVGIGLAGGVALLLFGLDQLTTALREVAGDRLRLLLRRVTSNRWLGVFVGAAATAVVQSSTATTVLVVGFVAAGLMTLVGSLGVILGANVGTTVTAQIVAFDVVDWALGIVAIGFLVSVVARGDRFKGWGKALLSLGLVFLGMGAMGAAMFPVRDDPGFVDLLARLDNPILGVLVGALVTAVVQASSAVIVMVMVLAAQGLIGLEPGIAIVIGANIGSCATAVIASLGRKPDAKRAALAHVIFNMTSGILWLLLLTPLARLAVAVSPTYPDLSGADRLAAEVPRQLANAHTLFNAATVIIFIGLLPAVARLLHRLVPEAVEPELSDPRFLDFKLLDTPAIALGAAAQETARLGEVVSSMVRQARTCTLVGGRGDLVRLRESDTDVDTLYDHIIEYLARLSEQSLPDEDGRWLLGLLETANALESIADLVETNLVSLGTRRLDSGVAPSDSTRELIESAFTSVIENLEQAVGTIVDHQEERVQRVTAREGDIRTQLSDLRARQAVRLAGRRDRRIMWAIEDDIIDVLKQIAYLTQRIVRSDREAREAT